MFPTQVGRLLSCSRQRLSLRFYHKAQIHSRIQPAFSILRQDHNQQNFLSVKDRNSQFLRLLSIGSIRYQSVGESEAIEAATAVIDSVLNESVPPASEASQAASSVLESIINSSVVHTEPTQTFTSSSGESVTSLGESVAASGEFVAASGEFVAASSESVSSAAVAPENANELILDFIPEKPVAPLDSSTLLGEPSLESLDLGSWWPPGRMQYFMDSIHTSLGLEWWQTIILTTLCVRIIVFPMVIKAQKNVACMNNVMPEMSKLQAKLTDARRRGDTLESAQLGQQLQVFMKERGVNPVKNIVPVFFQIPFFLSMFVGLRGMANCPVPSMETGGLFWFENLTMADPFYLLPVLTSTTLYLQLKLGTEGVSLDSMGPIGQIVMKAMPFVLIPFTMNFPAAVTFYWFTTNLVSVAQSQFIRQPAVRKMLGVPEYVKWDKEKLKAAKGGPKKGFREQVRESIDNWRVQGDIADRRAHDERMFQDAATAPIRKTYKYDPTKPINKTKRSSR